MKAKLKRFLLRGDKYTKNTTKEEPILQEELEGTVAKTYTPHYGDGAEFNCDNCWWLQGIDDGRFTEVIRCKDCKYGYRRSDDDTALRCGYDGYIVEENHYCSYAEHKK